MGDPQKIFTAPNLKWRRGALSPRRLVAQWLPTGSDVQSQNVRRVLIDGIGVGIGTAAAPYLPVFLARLGAQDVAIGLLTAMPALAGLFFAVPIGQFLARQRNIVPWYSVARLLVIACYALTGIIPFFTTDQTVYAIILIWAFATLPQTIVNVGFTVVMAGVAGPEGRYYLMSRRWSLLGLTDAVVVLLAGFTLERIVFPYNYQIVFVVLSLGGLLSFAFSSRIVLPDQKVPSAPMLVPWRVRAKGWLALVREQPTFIRITSSQFVYRFGLAFALPLFPLYYVHNLNASDQAIGLINTVQAAVLLWAYFAWARVTKQRGVRFALLLTTSVYALYPIILAFTTNVFWVIVLSGVAGIFAAGIDLVFFDAVVSSFPPERSATFVGLQQTTVYLGAFVAPLLATTLSDWIGIPAALVIAGLIRLVGFGLFVKLIKN